MQREKRIHPRIEVGWSVTMMTTEVDIDGEIENISAGGAYIRCGMLLFENDVFVLGIWDLIPGQPRLLWGFVSLPSLKKTANSLLMYSQSILSQNTINKVPRSSFPRQS
jgi:hypothetical protein